MNFFHPLVSVWKGRMISSELTQPLQTPEPDLYIVMMQEDQE